MQWTTYENPGSFALDHPVGWTVKNLPVAGVVVSSPDGLSMSVIQPMQGMSAHKGTDVIAKGLFHAATLFPAAKALNIVGGAGNSAMGTIHYKTAAGTLGRAQMSYTAQGDFGFLNIAAAPEEQFGQIEPVLTKILHSLRQNSASAPAPVAAPPAASAAINYMKFTDPQMGTFTMDVPQGWQVRGGLAHPMPGDRRPWIEAISPDGVYILCDPAFPQSFCHFPGQPEGQFVALAAGGSFMNLKPSAERVADSYLKNIAGRRFQGAKQVGRRPRPDIVNAVNANIRAMGVTIPKRAQTTAIEVAMQLTQAGQPRVASVWSMAYFTGEYTLGMWAFWSASTYLSIAPPALAQTAEQVTLRMIASYQNTQQMFNLVQRDESIIYANGQAANAAQWNWFAGQQAAHNAQTAMGDAIVNNYWSQQAANESMIRGWEQNQAVNDRLSQDRSDAMLGNQRLADDAMGKQYDVAAGSNFYWRNEQTGQIIGTETSTPPDYSNNYTQLRKM